MVLERRPALAVMAVFAVQLAIHLPRASTPALWGDEAVNLWWAELPFGELVRTVLDSDNPPLFFILLGGWIRVVGIEVWAIRLLPSLLAAVATAATFVAARRLCSWRVAWLVAPVLWVSPVLHEYARELRPSTLVCALSAVSIALLPSLARWSAPLAVGAFAAVELALACSHYLTLLFFPMQLAIAALLCERAVLRRAMLAQAVAALALAPILWLVVVQNRVRPHVWLARPGMGEIADVMVALTGSVLALGALLLLVAVVAWRSKRLEMRERKILLALAVWGFGPPLADALLSQLQPMFQVRYVLYAAPGLALLAVALADALLLAPRGRVALVLLLALAGAYGFRLCPPKPQEWDGVLARVRELRGDDTWLILHPRWQYRVLSYYLDLEGFRDPHQALERLHRQRVMTLQREELPDVAALAAVRRVVLITPDVDRFDPERRRRAALVGAGFALRDTSTVSGTEVTLFTRP